MMRYIIILFCLFVVGIRLNAQVSVKGVVQDSLGKGMAGVHITEDHQSAKSITDGDGVFEIRTVENEGVLRFRLMGYRTKELFFDKSSDAVHVILTSSSIQLNEVIVSTGYQEIPKERATGSFSTINNDVFNKQVSTNILSRLPAIANSVVMDAGRSQSSSQMMVRGLSTINGPKDPLIVIDNFPYDGDINNINPNIVENITILKDAAASSIWGVRAANGVIVITTKKGEFNKRTILNLTSTLTIGGKPDLYYIPQMSSTDFIDVEQELYARGFYQSKINSVSKPLLSPVVDLLDLVDNGEISNRDAMMKVNKWKTIDARDQFNRYIYKPSSKQQYFLNASGGSSSFSWMSAMGYDRNIESLGDTYQRINLRFQNSYDITNRFSLNTSLYYTQTRNKSGRDGYANVPNLLPYMNIADREGNALAIPRDYRQSFLQSFGGGQLLDWNYYPLDDWRHRFTDNDGTNFLATAELQYRIVDGLTAGGNYQYERQNILSATLSDENSYTTRDYINRFTQLKDGEIEYAVPKGAILNKANQNLVSHNIRGRLSYDRKFGKSQIIALAGAEIRSGHRESYTDIFYGYNPNNLTTGNVDYARAYPNIITGGAAYIQNSQNIGETDTRFVSHFVNAAYSWADKYTVSTSVRRDASNLFGVRTNDQWNPFWSAGLAWKLSNESFYRLTSLPYLNLKATYGFSGNVDPAMVAVNTITFGSPSLFTGIPFARITNFYNPLLKWETSKMLNLAIDFRAKNNRVSGTLEFYRKWGENLFGQAPIDITTGVSATMQRNVANMQGRGLDIELTVHNVDLPEFKWNSVINFSMYKDEIREYHMNRTLAQQYVNASTPPISGIKGKPVYAIYAYRWAGLDPNTGEAQGILNGEISKDYANITGSGTKEKDLEYFGSAIPTKYGNFLNSFSYKGFNIQFSITYKFGYWFRRSSINYTNLFNSGRGHKDYEKRWKKVGDELLTNVPVNSYTTNSNRDRFYEGASILVEKGDHVRLQYINLAYELPPLKMLKNLQLNFNIQDIGLLWKANKAGIDPDFNMGTGRVVTPTTWAFGIKAKI